MNKILRILFYLMLITVPSVSGQGKETVFDESASKGKPVFKYNIFRSLGGVGGEYILNVHAEIGNEKLQFIKTDSLYEASYTLSAAVFEESAVGGIPLYQEQETRKISVMEYSETQSPLSQNRHIFKFPASTGLFTAVIIVKDDNSGKSHKVKRDVEFGKRFETVVSDLRMVWWSDDNDFENTYNDLINNIVDKKNEYTGALFEIYSSGGLKDFSLRYKIVNSSGSEVYDDKFEGRMKNQLQYQVLKIPLENLLAGNYRIEMDIKIENRKYSRDTVFYLRWGDLSMNVADIDRALEQMLYIMEYDSIQSVLVMPEELKRGWFKDYWNGLETKLGLKKNSLMEEYFRRVAYSNLHFSVPQKDGWKTDMGKVLCMMGDPDEVQSYPFAKNQKPYEVWIYYDLNAQYIFDYAGGEYRIRK